MNHENISALTLQDGQSAANTSPTSAAQRPISVAVQFLRRKTKQESQHDTVHWEDFTKPFEKPFWTGKDSLAKYRASYDDLFEAEVVDDISWRPISTSISFH